jgi:hypothetical protein
MKIFITFSIIMFIANISFPYIDTLKKIDSSKLKKIEAIRPKDGSYQNILIDTNSLLKIKEAENETFWSFRNLMPIIVSFISVLISIAALVTTKNNFKREHVINLFDYWEPVNNINPAEPIYVDVKNAVNAITLTAIIWNYNIIDRRIIYTSHWDAFQLLYNTLINCHISPSGTLRVCSAYITDDITKAYNGMLNFN